jgi:hypothetical protein
MKRLFVGMGVGSLLLVLYGSTVFAGTKSAESVSINLAARTATGSLATARGSADANQLIGCSTRWFSAGTVNGSCFARNSAGTTTITCTFTSVTMAQAVSAIGVDGRIQFAWNASNVCTSIYVENSSNWAPKVP